MTVVIHQSMKGAVASQVFKILYLNGRTPRDKMESTYGENAPAYGVVNH